MASTAIAKDLKAWAQSGITTRWDAELLREACRQKKSEYNRTYRLRHREREKMMEPIYKNRWLARQRGVPPPPLPVWNGLEVAFARGRRPK